jgi:ferric-dicitrate binding protein FerR (iron transport regulator)
MVESFHIADLIAKKIQGSISPDEQRELDLWIKEDQKNQLLFEQASDPKKQLEKLGIYALFDQEKTRAKLEDELFGTRTVRLEPRKFMRYAAAILLPLLLGGGFAWWYLRAPSPDAFAQLDTAFPPGSQKAVLILSNGEELELEAGRLPVTLSDGDANITTENMRIAYTSESNEGQAGKSVFNELRTPRGGGYQLQLSDGSRVWLNSGSSLIYPVSFRDSVRQVILDGEAYFEVSHNGAPFIVSTGSMNTRVLGTAFNIEAFSEDPVFKTTLVEGRVIVGRLNQSSIITEGTILEQDQQATFSRSSGKISKVEVDALGYTSWIRGKLEFHNETLEEVMKRLARWYDFEYSFENTAAMDFHFSARLDKEESISSILKMLEMTTDVKFEFKNQSIVVL